MRKVKKNCIPNAKYKRNLHSQCQKFLKNAFPVPKIKKICILSAKNEKKNILPMQKMQHICIANARIKKFALPTQSKLKRLHCQKMKITIKIWYFWQGICRIVSNFLVFCYRGLPVPHCLA